MRVRPCVIVAILAAFMLPAPCAAAPAGSPNEYSKHFGALGKLSVAVAEAMTPGEYSFRPDPGSMASVN
jgi:hypothetical protein